MTETPNRKGREQGNEAILSWRDMAPLMDLNNKTTKGAPTPKNSSQIRLSLVPLRHFAQLPLLGQNKPDQGEESGTEPSSCLSRGLSSVEVEGVWVVSEDGNCDGFYRIAMLMWRIMNQWLFLLSPSLHRSHLQNPASQGWTCMAFCLLIMRMVLGEGWVNLDTWPLEWVRNHNTLHIFQVRKIYLPLHLEIQNGINCPGHTSPTLELLVCFLNIEQVV